VGDGDRTIVGDFGFAAAADLVAADSARAAYGALRVTDLPVLIAARGRSAPRRGERFARALVVVDDISPGRETLHFATTLSHRNGMSLVPCALAAGRDRRSAERAAIELLETSLISRAGERIEELAILAGEPAAAVDRAAAQHDCDLIVVATNPDDGFSNRMLGKLADAIIRRSRLPVLVARA
jgi:nucleotide-binding universal stress UspA family protein